MTDIDEYRSALEELEAAYAENQAAIAGIEEEWGNVEDAVANTSGETISYQEAAATAYQSVQSEVEELAQAYQDAYEAALESFQGQFGLFDEASTSSEEYLNSTVANAQAALESQLSYWTTYQQNISALKDTSAADLGITQQNYDALMSYVQSGSEEAAGLAASMVQAINSGNSEAVAELANTLGEVNSTQSEIASTTAEWQTGFTEQMNQYAQDMNKIVTEDLENQRGSTDCRNEHHQFLCECHPGRESQCCCRRPTGSSSRFKCLGIGIRKRSRRQCFCGRRKRRAHLQCDHHLGQRQRHHQCRKSIPGR